MEQDKNIPPDSEPTVLDLFKSVTKDWASFSNFIRSLWDARQREELTQTLALEAAQPVPVEPVVELQRSAFFPWRSLFALLLVLIAQFLMEPPSENTLALVFFLAAFGLLLWSFRMGEWQLSVLPVAWQRSEPFTIRLVPLVLALIFAVIVFIDFGSGLFTWVNTSLWVLSISLLGYSLWIKTVKEPKVESAVAAVPEIKRKWMWNGLMVGIYDGDIFRQKWVHNALLILIIAVALFFRLNQWETVPNEPFSDHAEKILDVYEITEGRSTIFFERNTGREAIQMYWTLLVLNVFGTGFTYLSLKLGTILLGILTLPYVYLLGKEYGNERLALLVLFLFGIAYWPNVISRIGLRFPLYPLFFAPTFFYLTRGLRTQNRNDFIFAGIFLGLGLHGYSPFRMVPIFVVLLFMVYFPHAGSSENRKQATWWFLIVVLVSMFVFLPLMRYWISRPDLFGYRAFTRLSNVETELPGPAWQIFLSNMYKGLLMFNWDDGEIWVHSVTHRPALDMITAALFAMGMVLLIARYIRRRDWRDMNLLVSIPMLIMPSVLSLAFPGENPSLNRTGAAAVPVILIGAMALDGFITSFGSGVRRQVFAYGLTLALLGVSAYSNYDLVFNQFNASYRLSTWNTSEIAKVIGDFSDRYGTETLENAWVVPYPYWVDTRLPGVWLGVANSDIAMWPDQLPTTLEYSGPKVFIFNKEDVETEKILRELYPKGKLSRYTSAIPDKDFFVFLVEQ